MQIILPIPKKRVGNRSGRLSSLLRSAFFGFECDIRWPFVARMANLRHFNEEIWVYGAICHIKDNKSDSCQKEMTVKHQILSKKRL